MAWPKVHWCAFRHCGGEGDRIVTWTAEAAGSSEICERHYRFVKKKFPHLIASAGGRKPSERFADKPKPALSHAHADQLEL